MKYFRNFDRQTRMISFQNEIHPMSCRMKSMQKNVVLGGVMSI